MIDAALLKSLAGSVTGGASVLMVGALMMFPSKDELVRHEGEFHAYQTSQDAKDARQLALDTVERAAAEQPGEYKQSLCRNLTQALAELCAAAPEDAVCMDRAILRKKAGCD